MVKHGRLIQRAVIISGSRLELIQEDTVGIPIVEADKCICWSPSFANLYSNLTLRHNNSHRSWGMTWVKKVTNSRVEL